MYFKTKFLKIIMVAACIAMLFIHVDIVYAADPLTEDEMREITEEIGEIYNICPELLQAIAFRESCYVPDAENDGCKGLMQISEKWHKERMQRLGVSDIYDPYGNVLVAADYLSELLENYGEVDAVLMFYSGNGRAEEYSQGIGQPSDYVNDVLELSAKLEREHGK